MWHPYLRFPPLLFMIFSLLCGSYRPDETSNCEWLAALANFPDGLFTNKAAGQTAHKDSPRRAPEIRKREGDLADEEPLSPSFFSSAHSLPPFPCRLIELSHASEERVPSWPQCVSVFLWERERRRVWWKEKRYKDACQTGSTRACKQGKNRCACCNFRQIKRCSVQTGNYMPNYAAKTAGLRVGGLAGLMEVEMKKKKKKDLHLHLYIYIYI